MFYTTVTKECFSIEGVPCVFDVDTLRESTRVKWERSVERRKLRIESILVHAPRRFSIATTHALDAWKKSNKRIVRCEDGIKLVGLLLMVE